MEKLNQKQHWETVYETKNPEEVSWTQKIPQTSLDFINSFALPKDAKIIDIGGGDSNLVDFLLEEGYENISVLDISAKAIEKAKTRLGEKAKKVNWVESDITKFKPDTSYDIWHDRATFHFLTTDEQITTYIEVAKKAVSGFMVIGTFSENGPTKCSGLNIKRYTAGGLINVFNEYFTKIHCLTEDHITPFHTKQSFLFCSFKRQMH
ncbi:class I SAM-dependent methyltransferase [Olivibacter ginsenosidimutans]